MRLSAPMRDALEAASRNPLRRTHDDAPGTPPWPAHPASLAALVRHGFLADGETRNRKGWRVQTWMITEAGHEALNPPPRYRPDRPLFMARCGAIRYRKLKNGRWAIAGGTGQSKSNSGDYTTDPRKSIDRDRLPGGKLTAVPIVEPLDLDRFAAKAREREEERRRQNGLALDAQQFGVRLEHVRLIARERRMDISREDRLIRYMAGEGREQSALRRLVRLETQLQQRAA